MTMQCRPFLAIAAAVTCMLLATGCAGTSLVMQSDAMAPALPRGAAFRVDYGAYTRDDPQRFDIVVFEYQPIAEASNVQAPQRGTEISYRVIGLPGETVEITADGIHIDGEHLRLPSGLAYQPAPPSASYERFNEVTLPENAYFLLGDNSARALDSRYWGWVTRERIRGKVVLD